MRQIGGMMDAVLGRHGIGKQVLAAQVVRTANEELARMVDATLLADMKALSLKDGVLTLACRHPVARYEAEAIAPALAKALEETYPSLTLRVVPKHYPEAFGDER